MASGARRQDVTSPGITDVTRSTTENMKGSGSGADTAQWRHQAPADVDSATGESRASSQRWLEDSAPSLLHEIGY